MEAEALGYVSTFLVEHHFTGFGQVSASLNLLTWIGARTTTLRLGTAVLVLPWHNPVLLAEQVATLDLLSGGRVDFGIGKGYRYNEFAGFCVPMEEADARFDEWRRALPRPLATPARFAMKGDRIEVGIPLPDSVTVGEAYFFPADDGPIDYAAPQSFRRKGDLLIAELKRA